jgi:NADPH:quinone reductase-like Zn-dependent oxidoreductase
VSWGGANARDPSIRKRIHEELTQMLGVGTVHPQITATFDLVHGVDALRMLADRRAVGKVIVRC